VHGIIGMVSIKTLNKKCTFKWRL